MGCVFRGLELVARIGDFGGDVRKAVEAGVLALNLPERETVEATIVQARNATCQAILSLTLEARKSWARRSRGAATAKQSVLWPSATATTGRASGKVRGRSGPTGRSGPSFELRTSWRRSAKHHQGST